MTKNKISPGKKKEAITAYIFLLPLFIGVILFFIIPIVQSFYYSLTDWRGVGDAVFIGLENFKRLFTSDKKFGAELRNTLVYVVGSIPLTIFLALLVANLLNTKIRGVSFYRVIYFLPQRDDGSRRGNGVEMAVKFPVRLGGRDPVFSVRHPSCLVVGYSSDHDIHVRDLYLVRDGVLYRHHPVRASEHRRHVL